VVNATGAWADELRAKVNGHARLRRLRGSHLVFPNHRLPLTRAVSMLHPKDGRPVFAFPWEGATIVGTTDIDHDLSLETQPIISSAEAEYLMELVKWGFPAQELAFTDVITTFSGVRPVINTGKADPSKESREHVLWCENGLLTVAGGKLTTFRLMAWDALKAACARLANGADLLSQAGNHRRILNALPDDGNPVMLPLITNADLNPASRQRLSGRYGANAPALLASATRSELDLIPGTLFRWAELRWAACTEAVIHLDDLLLRRLRLGLLLPGGGLQWVDRIRSIVQLELGWDDMRWEQELASYTELWNTCYRLNF
jgi:glycerol-3-phosphate dehydrogenase